MGIVFFVIASVLWLPATFVNIVAVMISEVRSRGFIRVIDSYFTETAIDIDRFGNRNFRTLLNFLFQRNGTQHGDVRETISSVLGKNQRDGKLTTTGKVMCWILDTIDPDHCKKSIQEFQ